MTLYRGFGGDSFGRIGHLQQRETERFVPVENTVTHGLSYRAGISDDKAKTIGFAVSNFMA